MALISALASLALLTLGVNLAIRVLPRVRARRGWAPQGRGPPNDETIAITYNDPQAFGAWSGVKKSHLRVALRFG